MAEKVTSACSCNTCESREDSVTHAGSYGVCGNGHKARVRVACKQVTSVLYNVFFVRRFRCTFDAS
jgi:hypothetical protein